MPLVLGFGISTPEHARQVSALTDGFIVGSALVRAGGESVDAVRELAGVYERDSSRGPSDLGLLCRDTR